MSRFRLRGLNQIHAFDLTTEWLNRKIEKKKRKSLKAETIKTEFIPKLNQRIGIAVWISPKFWIGSFGMRD